MNQHAVISELLLKYLQQQITEQESATLMAWVEQSDKNRQLFNEINNEHTLMAELRVYNEAKQIDVDASWERFKKQGWEKPEIAEPGNVVCMNWWRYGAAVAVALLLIPLFRWLFVYSNREKNVPVTVQEVQSDVAPISKYAYVARYNGDTIALNGLSGDQDCIKIMKLSNDVLSYSEEESHPVFDMSLENTVTVPKGGNIVKVKLPDGSDVWLNAESSIKYPIAFNDQERRVELTGEAYFEVNDIYHYGEKEIPFVVVKGDLTITALGHFNVNTYRNEGDIKVTLLDGRATVQFGKSVSTIPPCQQAVMKEKEGIRVVNDIDSDQVTAWRKGKFVFKNTNIQPIMRQMERWYDLNPTQYDKKLSLDKLDFTGEISRYTNANKVLNLLENTGSIKFRIKDRKIVVTQQ